jgi:GntR family transcriptional repressor for pyruvate dehydrogenase complex
VLVVPLTLTLVVPLLKSSTNDPATQSFFCLEVWIGLVKIEAVKKVTVTEQIMEKIADLITTGQLKPGEKLPNERELATQLGVTRGRVREALRALSLVGLITIKAGEGSFVTEREMPIAADTIVWMFHNELHNIDEVYAARKLIESEIYLTAAKNITEEQLRQLEAKMEVITRLREPFSTETVLQYLDDLDGYIGEICGNRIYVKLMQTIIHLRRETSLKVLQVPGAVENSIKTRTALIEALKSGDQKKVKKAVDDFFKSSKKLYESIY